MHSYLHKIFILVKSGCYNGPVDRETSCGSLFHELGPHDFLFKNNSLFPRKSRCFCTEPPELHRNSSSVLSFKSQPIFSNHFASRPLDLVQITFWSLSFYTYATESFQIHILALRDIQNSNSALRTSFLHIFSTVTPNQVILVPKL
jgi:hypothetical protein